MLAVCGLALGVEAAQMTDLRGQSDLSFYLTGYAMAGVGVLVAVVIAVLTLLVGAADQLLDARRPLASLAALGVDERTLLGVLRRQLSSTAVPAVVTGVLIGGVGVVALQSELSHDLIGLGGLAIGLVLAAALLGGGLVAVVCRLAAACSGHGCARRSTRRTSASPDRPQGRWSALVSRRRTAGRPGLARRASAGRHR